MKKLIVVFFIFTACGKEQMNLSPLNMLSGNYSCNANIYGWKNGVPDQYLKDTTFEQKIEFVTGNRIVFYANNLGEKDNKDLFLNLMDCNSGVLNCDSNQIEFLNSRLSLDTNFVVALFDTSKKPIQLASQIYSEGFGKNPTYYIISSGKKVK